MAAQIRRIAVYCGSNTGRGAAYMDAARALGAEMAARGMELVYGGTHKGLMGAVADGCLAAGGRAHGVITERLAAKGHTHEGLSEVEVLPSMSARKARMIALADAFIALPGGIGTLEEFMEVWTLNQLGELGRPAGLFDAEGYFQPFMGFIDHMIAEGFLPPAHRGAIVVAGEAGALLDGLAAHEPVVVPKWM
ncbi:TIGR00730 family Rossman fold protein [Rhodovulum sp. DZ06]|uniref:LOG family protein n=1 Tax=Rhodovulum sp. DZ06 TaxID=3425126 RepID=UPI003D34B824